jgi:hypothetical protein
MQGENTVSNNRPPYFRLVVVTLAGLGALVALSVGCTRREPGIVAGAVKTVYQSGRVEVSIPLAIFGSTIIADSGTLQLSPGDKILMRFNHLSDRWDIVDVEKRKDSP